MMAGLVRCGEASMYTEAGSIDPWSHSGLAYVYTGAMSLAAADRRSASDRAYADLLDGIQSGALPAGFVLAEVEQAARLGISRTPLREALRRLASDGLVVQLSPRVTVVADLDADDIRALFEE